MYFDHVVGVLAFGATQAFTAKSRNALSAIAPCLAVALANASANERVAEQSRRLAEQNELLEEQRSRIARTAQELQRAGALKDRFLASVSHELRTPMTVILGFTGTLLRGNQGDLNPAQRESLERVQRNAKLLLGLINDILDISKIEAGKEEIHPKVVSVPGFLAQIEADFGDAGAPQGDRAFGFNGPRPRGGDDGPREADADRVEPHRQRAQVHGEGVHRDPGGHARRRSMGSRRHGHRNRHSRGGAGDDLRGVPAGRSARAPRARRNGTRTRDRQEARALSRGDDLARERAGARVPRFIVDPAAADTFPACPASGIPDVANARVREPVLVVDDDEGFDGSSPFELEPYGVRVIEARDGEEGVRLAPRRSART